MRLRKRDVEALMGQIDTDPIGALTAALAIALDRRREQLSFDELLALAPLTDTERDRFRSRNPEALDELAARLNEQRTL